MATTETLLLEVTLVVPLRILLVMEDLHMHALLILQVIAPMQHSIGWTALHAAIPEASLHTAMLQMVLAATFALYADIPAIPRTERHALPHRYPALAGGRQLYCLE